MPKYTKNITEDADVFWKRVLAETELNIRPRSAYLALLGKTTLQSINQQTGTLTVACRSDIAKSAIEKQYAQILQQAVDKVFGSTYEIEIVVNSFAEEPKKIPTEKSTFKTTGSKSLFDSSANTEGSLEERREKAKLTSTFTFDNYISGPNNQMAVAIAQAVADSPGEKYNPVFIHSSVGMGKTHLIQAIGNRILERHPGLKVIYTTSESFTNELVEAIQSGRGKGKYTTSVFRNKFRKTDVFLIDDIQFIAGREATQEEFFHTFNALYMSQKQIIITSDKPPRDFTDIEERITSRFNSGIIVDIQQPGVETREAILRNRRDLTNDPIKNEVIKIIAQHITTNIRELEGAYKRVVAEVTNKGEEMTPDKALAVLGKSAQEQKLLKPINMNQVLNAVCTYYAVKSAEVRGKKRTKNIVIPRQIAMYLIKELTNTPYITIGDFLGGRDHTTVMHGVQKMEGLAIESTKVQQDITNVKQILEIK